MENIHTRTLATDIGYNITDNITEEKDCFHDESLHLGELFGDKKYPEEKNSKE